MDDAGDHLGRMANDSYLDLILKVTQVSTAVSPSAFGALPVTELKMFTSTKNRVTSNAIRPAIVKLSMFDDILWELSD